MYDIAIVWSEKYNWISLHNNEMNLKQTITSMPGSHATIQFELK